MHTASAPNLLLPVGLKGTNISYCSSLLKSQHRRSSVSFGWLHKEVRATEALKWEGDWCLHFHPSSIFHEDFSLSIKWSLVDKWRPWSLLCFRYTVWLLQLKEPVSLRKISCLGTHTHARMHTFAHISYKAVMKVSPSCCISGGRWRGESLYGGGMGKHAQGSVLLGRT